MPSPVSPSKSLLRFQLAASTLYLLLVLPVGLARYSPAAVAGIVFVPALVGFVLIPTSWLRRPTGWRGFLVSVATPIAGIAFAIAMVMLTGTFESALLAIGGAWLGAGIRALLKSRRVTANT